MLSVSEHHFGLIGKAEAFVGLGVVLFELREFAEERRDVVVDELLRQSAHDEVSRAGVVRGSQQDDATQATGFGTAKRSTKADGGLGALLNQVVEVGLFWLEVDFEK